MGKQKSKVELLYEVASKDYNLGTLQEFESKLQDDGKRKALFDAIGKDYNLGTFEDFTSKVKKKDLSQSSSPSGFAPSQSIKPGTSVFPQQQFSVTQQAQPMPVEERYKAPRAEGGALELAKYNYNKALTGIGGMASGFTDAISQIMVQILPEEALGGKTQEEAIKNIRTEVLPSVRTGTQKLAGAKQEAVERKRYDDNFITGAIGGAIESLPAMASPYGIGFFAQAYDGGLQSINNSKIADQLTETEKTAFASSVGAVGALIEKYGMDKVFGPQSKMINEFSEKVALKVLDRFAKEGVENVTPKMFNEAASQIVAEAAKRVTRAGGNIARAGGIEGVTGGLQETANITAEGVFNQYKDKQVFDSQSWGEMFGRVAKAAGQEAIGGAVLRGGFDAIRGTADVISGNFTPKTIREVAIAGTPEQVDQVVTALDEQLQQGKITPKEHQEAINTIDQAQQIDTTIPQDLTGEARVEANELIAMRNDVDAESARISQEMEATDPAFRGSYESRIAEQEGTKAVLNDAISGLTTPVIYRQVEGGFQKESNGKIEDITEAQFNYAKDNGFTGIKVEEQTIEQPSALDTEAIDNRLADIETELQDPDITEERIQELNQEKENLNATKESIGQIPQGGEQGNQLQREGTQEGQPQIGEGEGSIGQTTQPETNIGDSDNQGEGQEAVSGPPTLLPPTTMQGPTITPPTQPLGNIPSGPTPPTGGGVGGPTSQGGQSAPRSVRKTRREMLENLPKKKKGFSEWVSSFFEQTTDDKYRIASFLRDSGGKLVEAYMRLRQGASGAAKAFSEETRKAIFGDLSFKRNIQFIDTEGNQETTSERELLDDIITSRRIINIDEVLRKRFADMMALRAKVLNRTATPQEEAKYKQDLEYLRERQAIPPTGVPTYQEQKGEDGLTVANHKAYLLQLENQLPPELVQKLADKALQYNNYFKNLLTEQFNAGLINQAQYDALLQQDYAPRAFWERMMEDDMPSLGQREFMSKLNQGLQKLQGGSNKLVYGDYEALIDMMSVAAFNRILENKAANELAIFARSNPNNGVVSEAEYERDSQGAIKYDKFGNPKYKPSREGRGTIVYYDNGVKKRLDVPSDFETIWYDSRDYLTPEAAKNLRRASLVNLIKKGATEWNLAFGLLQFATLDAPHVLMFTGNYSSFFPIGAAQFSKDVAAVAKDLKNRTGVWKEASEAGAFSNLMSRDEDLSDPTRYLNRNQSKLASAGSKFIKFSGDVNEYFETLTRLAVFNRKKNDLIEAYKKATGNTPTKGTKAYQDIIAEAAFAAKSTVDFGKSGRATKAANNAFAYLNAATQTFNTSVTYIKNNPAQFMSKISQMGAVSAGIALYSMGFFEDDEEEKKRKSKIYNEIPDYVKRNKFVYVPSKEEEPIFRAMGLIDDKVRYIAPLPKPQVANFFLNAIEDAAVAFYMPEQSQSDKETLDGIALDIRNSLPFNPENIASRNPLIAASLAASNYDAFRKKIIVQNEQMIPDYQEGQDKKTVAPLYKAIGLLSRDVVGGEGVSPAISQAVVEKVITNPEKNPLFSLFFQPISYGAVKATGDEVLMEEFKDRFDPTLGFMSRIKGTEARKKQENKEVLEILDKKTYTYDGYNSIQREVFSGANDKQINDLINRLTSKETLSQLKNLDLTDKELKEVKDDFKKYSTQAKSIYQDGLPEWFSEIPKERSNEDKAKEILFNTSGMNSQQKEKIIRQLVENKFILPSSEKGSVRWHLKELQKK